jgi:hypothetical protein
MACHDGRMKKFDLIFEKAKTKEWRGEWDAYRTFWLLNPGMTFLDLATVDGFLECVPHGHIAITGWLVAGRE